MQQKIEFQRSFRLYYIKIINTTVQKELYSRNSHWLEGILFLDLRGNIWCIGTHPANLWTATCLLDIAIFFTIRKPNFKFSKLFLWNQARRIGHKVKRGEMLPLSLPGQAMHVLPCYSHSVCKPEGWPLSQPAQWRLAGTKDTVIAQTIYSDLLF